MDFGIVQAPLQKQSQHLAITQNVLQSLRILSMPAAELSLYLRESICENPLLDLDAVSEADALPLPHGWEKQRAKDAGDDGDDDAGTETKFRLEYGDIWRGSAQEMPEPATAESTFADMLLEQVNTVHVDEKTRLLCHYIIGCLNQRGWLDIPIEDLSAGTGQSIFDMTQALYYVQSLHPAGVGARNLRECLLLQLAQSQDFNPRTVKLVTEGLPLLAANNTAAVQKLLQCGKDAAGHTMGIIRKLNPIPSQGYHTGEMYSVIIPDVVVSADENGIAVMLNERYLPKLRVNREYLDMADSSMETAKYLGEKAKEARALQNAVEEREKTLAAVMRAIIQRQEGFFTHGMALLPMTQAEIAQELRVHISTVSRAVQGKYLNGPMGTVEIKKLFSGAVKAVEGEAVSANMVKRRLAELIRGEDSRRPLSDENLRAVLAAMNIKIARRTVAKYREELGIMAASLRKR